MASAAPSGPGELFRGAAKRRQEHLHCEVSETRRVAVDDAAYRFEVLEAEGHFVEVGLSGGPDL